jgi:Ribbon-helix-helix protein, copG family
MSQLARDKDRVHIGAHVDRRQAERLVQLAQERDRSVSSVLRIAIQHEIERSGRVSSSHPPHRS